MSPYLLHALRQVRETPEKTSGTLYLPTSPYISPYLPISPCCFNAEVYAADLTPTLTLALTLKP